MGAHAVLQARGSLRVCNKALPGVTGAGHNNDAVDGGAGTDYVVFDAAAEDMGFAWSSYGGLLTVTSPDGVDVVTNGMGYTDTAQVELTVTGRPIDFELYTTGVDYNFPGYEGFSRYVMGIEEGAAMGAVKVARGPNGAFTFDRVYATVFHDTPQADFIGLTWSAMDG